MPPNESLLSKDECASLFELVLAEARSLAIRDVEVSISGVNSGLTRFANNCISQSVNENSTSVSIRTVLDGRTARATTNHLDRGSIRRAVAESAALARSLKRAEPCLDLAKPESIVPVCRYDANTATIEPERRARTVADAIQLVENASQTAAGVYSSGESLEAVFNSRGISAYHAETMAIFSITVMDQGSSGWAKASAVSSADLDPLALTRNAIEKARLSREPREVSRGRYTVVLEPAAVLDLIGYLFGDFSGTAMLDQCSFLMNRLGRQVFEKNIHITDDVYHPLQTGAPFDGEGLARKRLVLVDAGVPRDVSLSRTSAARTGAHPTGHGFPLPNDRGEAPQNIVVGGGEGSINDLIATTDHGILVTRLWYIREVDPLEKIMTGMTRDGTFLIQDGQLGSGIKNLRFNVSLIEMLSKVEALSLATRASGEEAFDMVVPVMKVADFPFTDVTTF